MRSFFTTLAIVTMVAQVAHAAGPNDAVNAAASAAEQVEKEAVVRPEPPAPRPQPPAPRPEPPAPRPQPPVPQPPVPRPTPVPPRPTPVPPRPTPVPPRPTPVPPKPTPVPPKPTPVPPRPTPVPPKPTPVPPRPTPKPLPPAKPELTKPVQPEEKAKIQQDVIEKQHKQTEEAKAKLPPTVIAHLPPNAVAKVSSNGKTVTVKDPKAGATTVLNAQTGKPALTYTKKTGTPISAPKNGVTQTVVGNVVTEQGPQGYRHVVDKTTGVEKINFHGAQTSRTVVNNVTIINKSVVINNKTIVINGNRPMVRNFNPYDGRYVDVYRPKWFGQPDFMDSHWVYGGTWHVYGSFFAVGAFIPGGYVSPWWRPVGGFVVWDSPLRWDAWQARYAAWGWGWHAENFYPGYYSPRVTYPHFGYWIADYYLQRELETERLNRLAAEQYADWVAEENQEWIDNQIAIQQQDVGVSDDIFDVLADQAQAMVDSIRQGQFLYASNLINDGHIFTVENTLNETATIDGDSYQCRLHEGDLIVRDDDYDVDTEPVYDTSGNPVVDDFGNVETTSYVTMRVVSAKRHSCATGTSVVVQLDSLQGMLSEERARIQEGMELGVSLQINP